MPLSPRSSPRALARPLLVVGLCAAALVPTAPAGATASSTVATAPAVPAVAASVGPLTVWRRSTGVWYVQGHPPVVYGGPSDSALTADFGGDGRPDVAVWRPSTGTWYILGRPAVRYGVSSDRPVPADFTGDGRADIAVWRPSNGTWYVQGSAPVPFGRSTDVPVAADFTGDGRADIAVWRPSTGTWYIRGRAPVTYGTAGDRPLPADFTGDGRADIAVRRPSTGTWYVLGSRPVLYGTSTDRPVPADLTGSGRADIAVWRPSTGTWYVLGRSPVTFGTSADLPIALPATRARSTGTLFGALVAPQGGESFAQAIARQDAAYGRMPISRVFYSSPGPEPWSAGAGLSGRPVIVSFYYPPREVLAGIHDAAIREWFASAPRTYDTYWSYFHEPENNIDRAEFSAADYRAAAARIASLAAPAGNPRLHSTLILMCYTVNPTSGRDWHNYYAGPSAVSVVGFDCYNHGFRQNAYGQPSDLFGNVLLWAAVTHLPWGVPEVGSVKVSSDPSGEGRAAWLRGVGALLRGKARFVCYFDTSRRTDYRLTDAPSRLAWRDVVSSSG